MGEDGKIIYKVVLNDDGIENEAEAAGRKAGDGVERGAKSGTHAFQEMMIGAARQIGAAFVDMAYKAVKGVEEITKAGIEFNAKMETYQTAFTTLIGDAEAAADAIEQIRKDAASTPFDVDSLTQANQALLATGMDAAQARVDVMNLANAIAATGGGSAELSRMAANMQQIRNTGKATAMDIRQFANAGINIYGILADYLGITAQEAAELDVTYEQLTGAFAHAAEAGGAYAGALEAQSQTFNGRMSTLKDNALQLAGSLTEDLFNKLSGTALPMVMDWVATLLEAAQTNGIEGAIAAAREILSTLITNLMNALPEIMNAGVELIVGLLDGFAGSGGLLNVIGAVATILRALLNAIADHFPEIIEAGVSLIGQLIVGLATSLPTLVAYAGELVLRLFNAFLDADWSSIGHNIVSGIWNGISGLWGDLVDSVSNGVTNLWNSAKNALGIASPSKKFKYIGEMSVEGTKEGFEENEQEMTRVVHDVYAGIGDTAEAALRPVMSGSMAADMEQNVSVNLSATGSVDGTYIVVPLSLDGREIARATAWSMGQQLAWEEL